MMQSSSQAPKPRRFDASRRTANSAGSKLRGSSFQKEDKNMNTITNSSPRRAAKTPAASSRSRAVAQSRAPVIQSRLSSQKQVPTVSRSAKPKLKSARPSVVTKIAPEVPAAPLPVPSILPLDPNCNEPSLPCLCCDGRSPQDNNSMFNHNHNNNNTVSIRQQLQLPPPPPVVQLPNKHDGMEAKELVPSHAEPPAQSAASLENGAKNTDENADVDNKKTVDGQDEEEESTRDIAIDDCDDDETDSDDDDDDTLVPSCCDCPPSLLEFSLSSSTSSSSTSISSCSDLESDSADQCASMCSSQDQDHLSAALHPNDTFPEFKPPLSLPINQNPFSLSSHSPVASCSPDEGYPSALDTPSPDYLGVKRDSDANKLDLLDFLESVGEFGKMERFSQVIQVARWDLEGEQQWDVLRDRIDHLDRLEKVNREVKLAYIAKLHEKGFDLGDLEEQDLSDIMDEMGNIDIPWKLYKTRDGTMRESQEFSDAGVDLTAPSDCEDPLVPDSLLPFPIEPPPRPPKPPARHASVSSDLHTYINISRETTSMAVTTSPTLTTFSPNTSSPTFSTFRCEKPLPPSPPCIPPLPASKPVSYLTLYTTPSPPPSVPTAAPPIPPPRKRHLARKEAQRLAALQAEQEMTPLSLPPPTTRPPPLPPPPVISVTCSFSPPAIPPALPPPPSFHTLDVEIRKLLMLAGLTQAELLKLSPELGVCVGELDEEEEADNHFTSRSLETREFILQDEEAEKENDTGKVDGDGKPSVEGSKDGESKDRQRTTSFTEIARRRKKNTSVVTDHYYSTCFSNPHEVTVKNFSYPNELLDSPPPPPPPRPLPPIPPSVAPLKVSNLTANSKKPERFDWLIAFTPECEAPSELHKKSTSEVPKKLSSSGSSTGSGPKVTTFKELRFRNKSTFPPTKVITDPEPDPTIITPDPDILYNLRWRREKAGSDGSQWEYTSQAQALFMQPPPALTSMAALKEMLQRADQEGGQLELSQRIGCPVSDSSLWNVGQDKEMEEEMKERNVKEGKEEVRGRADGGRSLESRTSVCSPPLSLAQSSQPYFLHPAALPFHPDPRSSGLLEDRWSSDKQASKQWGPAAAGPACIHREDSCSLVRFGFNDPLADYCADSPHCFSDIFSENTQLASKYVSGSKTNMRDFDSMCNFDSLYCSDSEKRGDNPASVSDALGMQGCTTPYKNIDVMMRYTDGISAVDSLCSGRHSLAEDSRIKARMSKELPPLPTCYLYHPKNCPLHRGAPPRLSPIGALSPPHRSGAPPLSRLNSPLFPRSHTLPALAAPLYYPNLYPSIPLRAPPLPPKLYQGPPQPHVATVRSVSFAGSVQKIDVPWMGDDVELPVRGLGLTSRCLQEKKALNSGVSTAVEAILAQFSSSRTIVQKALSGDSTINPSLGRLVLQCLCPALHNLLTDGLKPHQSDVIAGWRPNSAWNLVQATTRTGLKTQALFNLQIRVGELPQLRQSKQKFNAFLLGLLNTKLLDFWLSHLQSCTDVLEAYYHPTSFMRLSLTTCSPLFEELLLVLQPLSLLSFNLDLLFQHHHLEADAQRPEMPSSPHQEAASQPSPQSQTTTTGGRYIESLSEVDFGSPEHSANTNSSPTSNSGSSESSTNRDSESVKASLSFGQTSPQLLWVQEKEIEALPLPNIEEDSFTYQAGQVIQQGWGAVVRWGGRLSQNLADLSLSAGKKESMRPNSPDLQDQEGGDYSSVNGTQVPWSLGRLFGASKSPNSPTGHAAPTRRPSQWLAPGVTALTRMVSSSSTPTLRGAYESQEGRDTGAEKKPQNTEMKDRPRQFRSVRTLCDHTGAGSELSFCKGEELVVLGGADQDWIRCRQGDKEGLVPIGYTSLIM